MIGVVLAGGASRRFGGQPKGLLTFAGRPMALRSADVLAEFCTMVAIEADPGAGYEALGLPLSRAQAEHNGKGPLAGIAVGLALAPPGQHVAFAPCDMPFLTRGIYDALERVGGQGAYASTPAGVEPLVAILNVSIREALLSALAQEMLPRTHLVLDAVGACQVHFPDAAAFANINTMKELSAAEVRLRNQKG